MKTATNHVPSPTPGGLRQRIRKAETLGILALLLEEGRKYDYASDTTKAAWHRTAERRRKELGA